MADTVEKRAERTLVAICAVLSLQSVRDENFEMWLACLREVLPDCDSAPLIMAGLRMQAKLVVDSPKGPHRSAAFSRLGIELRDYYAKAAGLCMDAYREAAEAQVAAE